MRRVTKISLCLVSVVCAWFLIVGIIIWNFGEQDYAKKSDCVIVLGAAVEGDKPSPVFEERIKHSISLLESGDASRIIFTGGYGDNESFSESEVAASYAVTEGVNNSATLTENVSRTTYQNLREAKAVMKENDLHSAIIVSDPLHLKRASVMAEDLGMSAVTSPTPTSRYRSLRTKLSFLVREVYFYNHYMIFGD